MNHIQVYLISFFTTHINLFIAFSDQIYEIWNKLDIYNLRVLSNKVLLE